MASRGTGSATNVAFITQRALSYCVDQQSHSVATRAAHRLSVRALSSPAAAITALSAPASGRPMASIVWRTLLTAIGGVLASYVFYLTATYWWPRFAGVPDLADGLVALGHGTASTQLVWLHCNRACRTQVCKKHAAHADRDACIAGLTPSVQARPLGTESWLAGTVAPLHTLPFVNSSVIALEGLRPCTAYEYRVSMVEPPQTGGAVHELRSNSFRSAPADDQAGCTSAVAGSDSSAPVVRVVWGSCLGVSPFSELRAFAYLDRRPQPTDAVVLLGDSVYTDIPLLEDSVAYAQIWNDGAFSRLFSKVPFYGTYDDHELLNDWSLADSHDRFDQAMAFFDEFVGGKNPPPPAWEAGRMGALPPPLPLPEGGRRFDLDASRTGARPRYFHFNRGAHASFFVLDTRQYASPPPRQGGPAEPHLRTKLGAVQLALLKDWLLTSRSTFKFLCSSTAWTSTAFKFVQDGWAAYTHERDALFDFIAERNVTGVVLLSADLHWAGAFHLKQWNLHEVTVSPIQSFGLPYVITPSDTESNDYSSGWRMHFGQIEVHSGSTIGRGQDDAASPWINITVYRYQYGEPKPHRSIVLRASDMTHRAVNSSFAVHFDHDN